MIASDALDQLLFSGSFEFRRLIIEGIDNRPVARFFSVAILDEEVCLMGKSLATGDDYVKHLHSRLEKSLLHARPLPVVRFADGEYAYYRHSLACNGLYRQAESVKAIKRSLPFHIEALRYVALHGFLAPLIFPGNSGKKKPTLFPFLRSHLGSARRFLNFAQASGVRLTEGNYLPFYAVYAYLTSSDFAKLLNRKTLAILTSDFNEKACRKWFEDYDSYPEIIGISIPTEYVATRWPSYREQILSAIPRSTEVCLVGAGIGALLVCRDVAERFSIPAIDAGHVLNMMNDRIDKSSGLRLYTIWKNNE